MCVNFYYSMYGAGMKSLVVSLKPEGAAERELWRRDGNQGQGWKSAEFEVDTGKNQGFYQVMTRYCI